MQNMNIYFLYYYCVTDINVEIININLWPMHTRLTFKEETSKLLHLEHSFLWCWRRMKINWTDGVRNEEVLHSIKKNSNILHIIK